MTSDDVVGQLRVDGVLWWDTRTACAQLRVQRHHLYDWVRRSRRGDPGFPVVDPPVRRGNTWAYRAQQLIDAEAYTAAAERGRVRNG